ncbi:TadE/TadG family type IV pilus assembly protein [Psychrobacter lutiphocae]|uniref:TadE/TadG family type IV pilus assembly protein n=1 Tax=Psychrobacter lutiphocae TaxID=540500 RepID=UPI00037AED19|nr:TadE family protein [Psychrobacter lutiphocae]
MKVNESGQAAVEFAVSVSVLIALVLAIPILAKIANANIMSIQALDYAAWRVREGNTNNELLSQEVSDRYFGETALVVDNEKLNHRGAKLGKGKDNQQIYRNNTVTINYAPDNSDDSWNKIEDLYKFGLYDQKGAVSINLPLENLNVIPEIVESLTIKKSLYVDNQTLTARDQKEIQDNMDNFNDIVIPYNNDAQKKATNIFYNTIIKGIDLSAGWIDSVFSDHQVEDVKVNHNEVPDDRLVEFKP